MQKSSTNQHHQKTSLGCISMATKVSTCRELRRPGQLVSLRSFCQMFELGDRPTARNLEQDEKMKYKGRVVRREATSRTRQRKEHQLVKWRKQHLCTQCPDFRAWQEKPTTQCQHTRKSKTSETSRLLREPETCCSQVWIRLPPSRGSKTWNATEEPVVTLERSLHGHPLAGLSWERRLEDVR